MRIGHGYDVHRLTKGRDLIIGGIKIDYEKGLQGHSDADVLTHAIIDALLGAAALKDIGYHFPDTDIKYKNASSIKLLKQVMVLLKGKGYSLVNIDCTIVAQAPKLKPYLEDMINCIANTIEVSAEQINIKATTEEGLGFTGQGLGIACHCVCLIA